MKLPKEVQLIAFTDPDTYDKSWCVIEKNQRQPLYSPLLESEESLAACELWLIDRNYRMSRRLSINVFIYTLE